MLLLFKNKQENKQYKEKLVQQEHTVSFILKENELNEYTSTSMVLNKSWPTVCTSFKEPIMPYLYAWYIDRR